METKIIVKGLRLRGHHGVSEQERRVGNDFVVDVELTVPFEKGAEDDQLCETINYASVIEVIRDVNEHPSNLLENFCWRIRGALISRYQNITGGRIVASKVCPPVASAEVESVGVSIAW